MQEACSAFLVIFGWQLLQELPRCHVKLALLGEGWGRPKKKAECSRPVGRQARELTYKACLGQPQDVLLFTPACQILKVCVDALTGFRHIPGGLNRGLSRTQSI